MREIKFRAWDKENERMFHEITIGTDSGWRVKVCGGINGYEFTQYTGLKDKNGKEVYEGDIVEYTRVNYTDCSHQEIESIEEVIRGEMYYAEGLWPGIRLINRTGKLFLPGMVSSDIPNIELEIIGNIYENPELLN
jgi:uncharacterized phage protein (TIGR01671 family)